jgi:signal transduction histidine kinase
MKPTEHPGPGAPSVGWWFAPLADRILPMAVWYLFSGMLLGWIYFAVVLVILSVSLVLVVVVVGVPLTIASFAAVSGLASLECRRASLVGVTVTLRSPAVPGGFWSRFVDTLGDPVRWRQVAFLLMAPLVATAAFVLSGAAWALPISFAIRGLASGGFASIQTVLGLAVAALLLPLSARLTVAAGRGTAWFTSTMVGVDAAAEAQARVEELTESRAEILEAVAAERRRIERNLHDGVQQRLVALGIDLGMAERKVSSDPEAAAALLASARTQTTAAIAELRSIGRGMHPAVLGDRGLDAALSAVVGSASIPVQLDCRVGDHLSDADAETAWFVVNEAMTNVMKHAGARSARVTAEETTGGGDPGVDGRGGAHWLDIEVFDDGRGGAKVAPGGGLAGIAARVKGADGEFMLDSPPGGPTSLRARIPVQARS